MEKEIITYDRLQSLHTNNVVCDVQNIIRIGRNTALTSANNIMTLTYWNVGRRIVEEEQKGEGRATYGEELIKRLSKELTAEFGRGYSPRYLAYFRKFYLTIPDVSILQSRLQNVSWTHITKVLRVDDPTAIRWYLELTEQ